MVLTGKQSLDYSGGVSAEDNFGIGGYDRVMGPNGQAQYWAPNLVAARARCCSRTTTTPTSRPASGTHGAPTRPTRVDRDVAGSPTRRRATDFRTVGDIFSAETNTERKKPFDIRTGDARGDRPGPRAARALGARWPTPTPRSSSTPTWAGTRSRCSGSSRGRSPGTASCPRTGPTSGPRGRCSRCRRRRPRARSTPPAATARWWCWPTCPASTARRSRCASASSSTAPRSAGRSSTSTGPIVFCVVSRYHGGAFVVFSGALNDNMEVVAVEGSYASVIGGAPAAAVVFTRDVQHPHRRRPAGDGARGAAGAGDGRRAGAPAGRARRRPRGRALREARRGGRRVRQIHNIERALEVGSVDTIIPAEGLRPLLVAAIERGLARSS